MTRHVPTYTVVAGRDEYRVHRSRELAERVARALGGYIAGEQWAESLAA